MIKALAPGMRRGWSWVWLSVALAGGFPRDVHAQSAKKAEPAAAKKADEADADDDEEMGDEKGVKVESFKDPRAEKALKVFKTVSGLTKLREGDRKAVLKSMAGGGPLDPDVLRRFVQGEAYELVDKTNINSLIDPPEKQNPGAAAVRGVQRATDDLLDALNTARVTQNADFQSAYNDALLETLPKLLDNNLIARVQAMIVLGQTGSPKTIPVFLAQLRNKDQTLWVKLWALRGLSHVVDNGTKVDAIGAQATDAARAISDFLDNEKDIPWPVQMRALRALGAMRQASAPNELQRVGMASTAMRYLADSNGVGYHDEVRAAAAWALGMLRVNPGVKKYNYALIAYDTGRLAADLGEQVGDSITENPVLAQYLTAQLLSPIYQAFNGLDGARDSGLLKPAGGNPDLAYTRQIADLSAAVTKSSVELVRAARGQVPNLSKTLGERVAALNSFLDKNPPKGYKLVPDGPEFRPPPPQVAGKPAAEGRGGNAAGNKPEVAGAGVRGGR